MRRSGPFIPLLLGLGLLASGCNFGASPGAETTATLTSDDVMATAEAIAAATRQAVTAVPSPVAATATPSEIPPTEQPSETPTPESPLIVAEYNANVRSGPGEVFPVIDFLLQGDEANAVGQFLNDSTGTWYLLRRIGQGRDGWIWGGAVRVAGDPNLIAFVESPPTPTPGPSPTPTGPDE